MYYYICKNSETQKGVWSTHPEAAAIRFAIWFAVQHATKPSQLYAVYVQAPGADGWQSFVGNYENFFVAPH